ncbi:uncharacterized protein VTP21DRAFT_5293 [Calcarisporiella thermophila]|uniref:uncharacterized protein n=1 Tax=Calcarisporiella thermophila TaxID=911321 RepID=UPI0037421F7B
MNLVPLPGSGFNASTEKRLLPIAEMRPQMRGFDCEVIVLEKAQQPRIIHNGQSIYWFLVADISGTITMSIWGEMGKFIKQGDILRIIGGEAKLFRGSLQLTTAKYGKVKRIGEFHSYLDNHFLPKNQHHRLHRHPNESGTVSLIVQREVLKDLLVEHVGKIEVVVMGVEITNVNLYLQHPRVIEEKEESQTVAVEEEVVEEEGLGVILGEGEEEGVDFITMITTGLMKNPRPHGIPLHHQHNSGNPLLPQCPGRIEIHTRGQQENDHG